MHGQRYLVVTADDFGIGPATSQGILDLAAAGLVTGSVLLVNSPYAEEAVRAWRRAGEPMELGWHPCLTLDRPLAPPDAVTSLVAADGRFWSLGAFVRRLWLGQVSLAEVERELRTQYGRCCDLLGGPPPLVNAHHHVQVFAPVGALLRQILQEAAPRPYFRRVVESWRSLGTIPGARLKRSFLAFLGGLQARRQAEQGFPGNDGLAGVTDPGCVADPAFLERWLTRMPGKVVELTCHPGYADPTLLGRDCRPGDGLLERRIHELDLLRHPRFPEACRRSGLHVIRPSAVGNLGSAPPAQAA